MSIWDKLKAELVDIIEWLDDTNNTIVYRFDRVANEIKYGAKLVVREGQAAVFVNEGQIADVYQPGTHTLETQNMPILATLKGWKYGFNSPFKAEVYFVSTRQFTDLKWGTMNPIMMRDPEFGPVRIRAFGSYTMRVKDPGTFIKQASGTDGRFTTEEITSQLRNLIVSQLPVVLGELKMPILDLAAQYQNMGDVITFKMRPEFEKFGLDLPKLLIENVSLPPEVEAAMDKRSSMGVIGDLNRYTQFQAADSLKAAAENPGGTASAGMGMGMGFAMAQQMGQAMANAQQQNQQPQQQQPARGPIGPVGSGGPPPIPGTKSFFMALNNQQAGPFDGPALAGHLRSGNLTRDTLVWCEGMANWAPAGGIADLAPLFASAPPPFPPPAR